MSQARLESFVIETLSPLLITYARERDLGVVAISSARVTGKSDLVEVGIESLDQRQLDLNLFKGAVGPMRSALAKTRTFSRRAPEVRICAHEDKERQTQDFVALIERLASTGK